MVVTRLIDLAAPARSAVDLRVTLQPRSVPDSLGSGEKSKIAHRPRGPSSSRSSSGEVRLATWDEIDTAGRVWTIPAERMKMNREHRVPLSPRALAVLDAARSLADGNPLVFPNRWGNRIRDTFLSQLLKDLDIPAVPHGFRSSFRDWAAEETDHPREVIEAALAHVVQNKVEAAYARSDLFERRRRLMDDWAEYVGRRRR